MLLLSAGWNDDGQLGRYVDYEEEETDLPAGAVDVKSNDIKKFAAGLNHSVLVFNDGTVIGWGSNHQNQIGLPEKIAYPVPTEIAFFKDKTIIDVACTTNSSIYLSEMGFAYIANKYNPKGHTLYKLDIRETCIKVCNSFEFPWIIGESGKSYEIQKKNKIVKHQIDGYKIVNVSSGKTFTVAITNDGMAHGIGEIAMHSDDFVPIPSLLDVKVTNMSANNDHCFVVSDKGRAYAWGKGEFGQLGLGEKIINASDFVMIDNLRDVSDVSTSAITTCFITDKKKLYACGSFGSYLIVNPPEKVFVPTNVTKTVYGPAHSVSCGDHHTLIFVEGLLRYRDRTLDPELLRLRDELELSRKRKAEEEMLKKKAEEENSILEGRYLEEREMKRKAEEEAELLRRRKEEEDAERWRREEERKKREEELNARNMKLQKEADDLKKKADEEIKTRDVQINDLNQRNAQASNQIDQLNKQLAELKELAAKSKCCNIC